MKRSIRTLILFSLAALLLFLPLAGCASTSKDKRPVETVDDFMMLSKPENPDAKY